MVEREMYAVQYGGLIVYGVGTPHQLSRGSEGFLELDSAALYSVDWKNIDHMLKDEQIRTFYSNYPEDKRCQIKIPKRAIQKARNMPHDDSRTA